MSAPVDLKLFDIQSAAQQDPILVGVLHLDCETITIRELIRRRIMQEVEKQNAGETMASMPLVQPSEIEQRLNRTQEKRQKRRQIDAEKQIEKALHAFDHNGFFVLVNDRQMENLDEIIVLSETCEASFFKLVPLVGG